MLAFAGPVHDMPPQVLRYRSRNPGVDNPSNDAAAINAAFHNRC